MLKFLLLIPFLLMIMWFTSAIYEEHAIICQFNNECFEVKGRFFLEPDSANVFKRGNSCLSATRISDNQYITICGSYTIKKIK